MKKFIATILSVVMIICSLGVSSLAADDKAFYFVLGDSIAFGSGLTNPREACYGKIVADTNGYEYVNHSIPGHTTTNLINRLSEEAVIEAVKKADIISISIGGNDFLLSDIVDLMYNAMVNENYEQFDEIADGFYTNFCTIVDIINSHNPDAVILMQTLYNPQSGYIRDVYQQGADRINDRISKYNKEHPGEIVIVDVATPLGDNLDNYAEDSIHPSTAGNEIIAQEVLNTLSEIGLGSSTEMIIAEKGKDIEVSILFTIILEFYASIFHVISVIKNFFINLF